MHTRRTNTWPITAVAAAIFGVGLLAVAACGYDLGALDGIVIPSGVAFVVVGIVVSTFLIRRRVNRPDDPA